MVAGLQFLCRTVKERNGGRRLPEGGMPMLNRGVIGDHCGLLAMAIVQYFAQVVAGDLTSVSGARPQSSKTRRSALAMLH